MSFLCGLVFLLSCRSTHDWRVQADEQAEKLLSSYQESVSGKSEEIQVESPGDSLRRRLLLEQGLHYQDPASLGIRDLPENEAWQPEQHLLDADENAAPQPESGLRFSLVEALQVAAYNSREFQSRKDNLYRTALNLDLETERFRNTFAGMMQSEISTSGAGDNRVTGINTPGRLSLTRKFRSGVEFGSAISLNLVKMLTGEKASFWGLSGDASVAIPLLRGAGEFVAAESLTQAERNLLYAVRDFEQYKRSFVVRVAQSYLNVLQSAQRVLNQEANYKRVVSSTRRSRRMADAGRLPEYQFDQAVQDELNARDRWISSCQSHESSLDSFKVMLGLPADAIIELPTDELAKIESEFAGMLAGESPIDYSGKVPPADAPVELKKPDAAVTGKYEIDAEKAVKLALSRRLDLQTLADKVNDAQRKVRIAADALRAELTLGGSAAIGQSRGLSNADPGNASINAREGRYSGLLTLDLPLERSAERNNYRQSLLELENAVRNYQGEEDNIKQTVRANLRALLEYRESLIIQSLAVKLANRRVASTDLLLQAGRAEIRDLLEAQGALLSAENSLTAAVVGYRMRELELQSNLGVLSVNVQGEWQEMDLSEFK
ncbi:MAG: TolC family protein [Oligosphaeraceae bacterium]|nr:TolC family protein [Oligosphaeraceae bacterium]